MRVEKLPQLEADFLSSAPDHQLKSFSIPVPGEDNLNLQGQYVTRNDGFTGFYEPEKIKKEQIVVHYTIGHVKGDITTLTPAMPRGYPNNKNRLSVAYVIARDGTIYQLFHSAYWAFHLGTGAVAGNQTMSQKSIGIELSNFGPLKLSRDGTTLETVYSQYRDPGTGRQLPVDNYCLLSDEKKYVKVNEPFKDFEYFATFTQAQYRSLIILTRYLTAVHEIPRNFLDESVRYQASVQNATFNGIVSHVNHRETGKSDIGPAFDWKTFIDGVKAPGFNAQNADLGTGTLSNAALSGALAASGLAAVGVVGLSGSNQIGFQGQSFTDENEMITALEPKTRGISQRQTTRGLQMDQEEFMEEASFDPWRDEMLE
ncbi:MAG: N-acetylmuramoyl-L-alanine amidase [Bacteroidetes bacterium]|nr:N-acetylmuramoyl-L-alanine amidase [Bacteroidota bacterium]